MLTHRLVRLIESHSEALASELLEKVQQSEYTRSFSRVPSEELRRRVCEIYQHLGDWLLARTDADLERRYREIGARRFRQRVPLAELIWAITLAKQTLWEFLSWESVPDRLAEVFGELELLKLLGNFFDRAIHWASLGYEDARVQEELAAKVMAVGR
jgi:hypothetical protein